MEFLRGYNSGDQEKVIELLTAPPRFGKSVNLTMFRTFFEIEVDKITGAIKTKKDYKFEPVTDTENYSRFLGLKIMQHQDHVKNHLGRHPVLYVRFKCNRDIKFAHDAIDLCKHVAHNAFREHDYLCNSDKLTVEDKLVCKKWCFGSTYTMMDPTDALQELATFLNKHFERDVMFLVDEYDSLVARALVRSKSISLEEVCRVCRIDQPTAEIFISKYENIITNLSKQYKISMTQARLLIDADETKTKYMCHASFVSRDDASKLVGEYEWSMARVCQKMGIELDDAVSLINTIENSILEICKKPIEST